MIKLSYQLILIKINNTRGVTGGSPAAAIYIVELPGPDHPEMNREVRAPGPDDPGQGRIIPTCAEGFGRMIRNRSGSSGFSHKVLPKKIDLMIEF